MFRTWYSVLAFLAGLVSLPSTAIAQDLTNIAQNETGDTAWIIVSSLLVLLMALPGLAFFYGGMARAKNALSVSMQLGAIASVVSVLWVVVGYTLAFGDTVGGVIGNGRAWMLGGLTILRDGMSIPESTFALFQMGLVIFAAALMVGAWADRARFGWVVAFAAIWSLLVYAPIAHWIWGGGWLGDLGVVDYAGGLIVNTAAGVSALVVSLLMGKRQESTGGALQGHAPMLIVIGASIVWIGWFGRTGGAALTATDDASAAIINTHLAAASAALTWLLADKVSGTKPGPLGLAFGLLAGLVTITPAAGLVAPGAAIITGVIGALVCRFSAKFVGTKLSIDDAASVFAVHGVGGMVGTVLLGLFAWQGLGGTGYSETSSIPLAMGTQALGVVVVTLYTAFVSGVLAVAVSLFIPMRVSEEDEKAGLDESSHGQSD